MKDIFDNRAVNPMRIGIERDEPYDDSGSIFELKLDGGRNCAYLDRGLTDIVNKRAFKVKYRFPELFHIHKQVRGKCILDGEIVIFKNGVPDFEEYNRRSVLADKVRIDMACRESPATFVAYDIVYSEGREVAGLPLMERKALLHDMVIENELLAVSRYVEGQGTALFSSVHEQGLEGIVGKRKDSPYCYGEKSNDWTKVKNLLDDDYVVCGYATAEGRATSLVLGQYTVSGDLAYKGRVALGQAKHDFKVIQKQKHAPRHPFAVAPPSGSVEALWLEPSLVCVVSFTTRNDRGVMRDPAYKGLRLDKEPHEAQEAGCNMEKTH